MVDGNNLSDDREEMDLSGSEQSSGSVGSPDGSFPKIWGTEASLLLGLKDGSLAGLTDLVQDKDAAAKAVAFVVNGSRRGIVHLCADVASLLRNKLRLERTISKQRAEIQRLRNGEVTHVSSLSGRTSRSTSPTIPFKDGQLISRPGNRRLKKQPASPQLSSPCSPCSSPRSPSPPLPNSLEISSASCGSMDPALPVEPHPPSSPKPGETSAVSVSSLLPNQQLVTAEVHRVSSAASIASNPANHSGHETRSVETQCSLDQEGCQTRLHNQYQEACEARAALESELQRLRSELEQVRLGSRVNPCSAGENKTPAMCEVLVENETASSHTLKRGRSHSVQEVTELPHSPLSPTQHDANFTQGLPAIPNPRISPRNSDLSSSSSRGEGSSESSAMKDENLTIRLDDHVLIKGERTGHVRYIGHLDRSSSPSTVYVGIHLDAPVGKHDGTVHGRRYFWCPRNHGIFVPVNEVMTVINRKPSKRPKTCDTRQLVSTHGVKPTGHHAPETGQHVGEMRRTRPGRARRLISVDSSTLQKLPNR
ncbi:uncharacterized protein [Diadema antillarum]|uniref:uncharacterized protein n=1 Tax=Diadema antillarum TaxID=105358 RepID=UPI003A85D99E